jgi:hypothetical protein
MTISRGKPDNFYLRKFRDRSRSTCQRVGFWVVGLVYIIGGDTRDPKVVEHEDPRKSVKADPYLRGVHEATGCRRQLKRIETFCRSRIEIQPRVYRECCSFDKATTAF